MHKSPMPFAEDHERIHWTPNVFHVFGCLVGGQFLFKTKVILNYKLGQK